MTNIEANACGTAVIAANSPGLRDSVRDGETGVLVPYGDAEAMASAAIDLIRDRERREAYSAAARQWAASFSWDRCAAESLGIFAAAAERRRGRRGKA